MKPTCKKRIYLTKQNGPRTKYVTPGNMFIEIIAKTPLMHEAEILRACIQSKTAGWRMIKTGVTRLGNEWIQDGVKFVDYVIPLIPNHAAAGFGTSIVSLTESQAVIAIERARKRLKAKPFLNEHGVITSYRFSRDGTRYEVSNMGMLVCGAGFMHPKGLDGKTWEEWYCKRIDKKGN